MRTASRALCGVALASLLALPAAGQPPQATLPDTTPGRLMAEWLAMCGKPDLQQMTAWQQEHLREQWLKRPGANVLAEGNVSECRANGGFRVTEIIESTPQQLLVMAAGPALDTWYRMFIAVDEGGKAGPVQTSPAPPPEASLPKDLSDQAVAREVAATVDRLHAAGLFSGIAMIARGTQPFVTHAAGHADRTKKTPITPSTQFTIGSMGKMFTAAAIGQLVDQGKVSFDDTVGKFFPDFANETVRNKVTVAMLLTHTSGMGDFLGRRTPEMMQKGVARADEFVPLFEKDAPAFEPGARSSYSNAGLALLGAIVERASGEDYPAYIRKHVFEPAGMTNSDPNNRPGGRGERMVTPYTRRRPAGQAAGWQEAQRDIGSPAGGAVSTAEDLLRFGEALRSGKLVSRATFEKMAYPHVKNPSGGYGYAMNVVDVYGRTVVGHGGGFPGVSTELYIVLDSPYVGVVLANQDPPAAEMVGEKARAMLAKMAGPPPAPDIAGAWEGEADVKAAAAAGSNVVALYAEFKRDGTKLSGTVGPSPSMQMPLTAVTLVGRTLTFTAATPLRTLSFQLTVVSPDRMEGTLTSEGEGAAGPVTFKRVGG